MKFDPSMQYGDFIDIVPSYFSAHAVRKAKALFRKQSVALTVPKKYRKHIKWIIRPPIPMDNGSGELTNVTVAWKVGPIPQVKRANHPLFAAIPKAKQKQK